MFRLKEEIKQLNGKISFLFKKIDEGGVDEYEECDVVIDANEMTKNYYFDNELVGEEVADENYLQLEIEEEND